MKKRRNTAPGFKALDPKTFACFFINNPSKALVTRFNDFSKKNIHLDSFTFLFICFIVNPEMKDIWQKRIIFLSIKINYLLMSREKKIFCNGAIYPKFL